jgi:hypothetical protein
LTRTKVSIAQAILLAVGISVANGQPEVTKYGSLVVHITSLSGDPLPAGKLSIHSKAGTLLYSAGAKDQTSTRLPYGNYVVSFDSEFLRPVRREVKIDRPDCFLVLATDMDSIVLDISHDPVSVSVRIRPPDSCTLGGVLWVKLVGVFSDLVTERRIGPGGFALFEPVDPGAYVAIIVDGQRIRAVQSLSTWGPVTTVEIPLKVCK